VSRVIVTGAASGIGLALAEHLVAAGHRVGLTDRRADAVAEAAGRLGQPCAVADVGDPEALTAAIGFLVDALGGLDGLVNNAGVGNLKRLTEYSDKEFDLLIRVNLTGVFSGMRAAVALMSSGGSIVNVASASGVRPTWGEGPYAAAKAGVIALTMSAAMELGPDIRVNCVSPGFIRTALNEPIVADPVMNAALASRTPAGRVGEVADVCGVIDFLLSDAAAYITGQNLVIDGGAGLPAHQTHDLLKGFTDGR